MQMFARAERASLFRERVNRTADKVYGMRPWADSYQLELPVWKADKGFDRKPLRLSSNKLKSSPVI
jgi:hypothetical protein